MDYDAIVRELREEAERIQREIDLIETRKSPPAIPVPATEAASQTGENCPLCSELEQAHQSTMEEYVRLNREQSHLLRQGQPQAAEALNAVIERTREQHEAAIAALLRHRPSHEKIVPIRGEAKHPVLDFETAQLWAEFERTVSEFDMACGHFKMSVADQNDLRNADGYHQLDRTFKHLQIKYSSLQAARERFSQHFRKRTMRRSP